MFLRLKFRTKDLQVQLESDLCLVVGATNSIQCSPLLGTCLSQGTMLMSEERKDCTKYREPLTMEMLNNAGT